MVSRVHHDFVEKLIFGGGPPALYDELLDQFLGFVLEGDRLLVVEHGGELLPVVLLLSDRMLTKPAIRVSSAELIARQTQ